MVTIKNLHSYPLKGARGVPASELQIDPAVGVVGDRRYALKRKGSVPDTWSPKGMFFVGMNTPSMVAQTPAFDASVPAHNGLYALDEKCMDHLGRTLGVEQLSVLDTAGTFNATDTQGPSVSLLSLATVRALSEYMGVDIDPARFRMNVWFDGLPAFEELTWVETFPGTREVRIGSLRFHADDICERCKAVEANPLTGEFDLEVLDALDALMQERGYAGSPHRGTNRVMGVIARPLDAGILCEGDVISC
jgi:uncharacterized protein YcbX